MPLWKLPTTATAPFCPTEVQGSVTIPTGGSEFKKALMFLGPGLLVSVGYMDPGNWATDIEAGARFGYALLFVVLASSMAAIILQCLSMRVGLITGKDLAQLSRARYSPRAARGLWILAELALVATDVAEVLGAGLAFKLLLNCSLRTGIALTVLDTIIVLGLKGKGFRRIEAIILGLISTIGICYFVELFLIKPDWFDVARGLWPQPALLPGVEPWYLAIGILGATVMPHNLYLHSSIVHTRLIKPGDKAKREALRLNTYDTVISLSLAFVVNAAILILAGGRVPRDGSCRRDRFRRSLPSAGSVGWRINRGFVIWRSPPRGRPKFDLYGDDCGPNCDGRFCGLGNPVLATPLDHARLSLDSGVRWRRVARRSFDRASARAQPSYPEFAIALCRVSAATFSRRRKADGRISRPRMAEVDGLDLACPDLARQPRASSSTVARHLRSNYCAVGVAAAGTASTGSGALGANTRG